MALADVNPLLAEWSGPFGAPPFRDIRPEHFRPAFDTALARHKAEIDAIAADPEEPDFENTIAALERSGRMLDRVCAVFFNLTSADTSPALQAIEREIAPVLARHGNEIHLNEALFRRICTLWERRDDPALLPEQVRVVERMHTNFVRAGAALDAAGKRRLAEITERLATLGILFSQNVLADETGFRLVLEGEADLAGLPVSLRHAAAAAAKEQGLDGKHVITLARSSVEPFLQFSDRRDLRETAYRAWIGRGGNGDETDNGAIISESVSLRAERARLLGFASFADYRIADTMAKTPEAARELLETVWAPAKRQAAAEEAALQEAAAAAGGNFKIAGWDWRYYAEAVRKARYDFDGAELKPYLQLENMIAAAFDVAHRLFGLSFTERKDVETYHPDVRAWEVSGTDGRHVGLFLGDYFARPSKRSGAWMSSYRDQHKLDGDIRPIVVNVMSFSKPPEGEAALLSFDDARTLFHEFGHALHGLLSDVTYPLLSGTNVARDFVELPSQLYEHWLEQPEVLGRFARHVETGEPMPEALLKNVLAARNFNQGFATVEYLASALVDLDLHRDAAGNDIDVMTREQETLDRIGMPQAIAMRHRTPHFAHIFAGDHYAAGYYSYLWSEVLDADAFAAFEEAGDIFDAETAKRLHDSVYSAGNRRDPAEAYTAFRGRLPTTAALLRKRGLTEA